MDDKYAKYANFKKRILLKAQADIEENTDIRFTFEEISEYSRRVEKLAFTIYKNKREVIDDAVAEESGSQDDNSSENPKRHDEIRAFGVSKAVLASQIIGQYDEAYIIQTLKYCKLYFKTKIVAQKAGFFLKALSDNYFKDEIEKENSKKSQKKILQLPESEDIEKQQEILERKQNIEKLKEEYLTDEFVEAVLEERKDSFLYSVMEKSRKN